MDTHPINIALLLGDHTGEKVGIKNEIAFPNDLVSIRNTGSELWIVEPLAIWKDVGPLFYAVLAGIVEILAK